MPYMYASWARFTNGPYHAFTKQVSTKYHWIQPWPRLFMTYSSRWCLLLPHMVAHLFLVCMEGLKSRHVDTPCGALIEVDKPWRQSMCAGQRWQQSHVTAYIFAWLPPTYTIRQQCRTICTGFFTLFTNVRYTNWENYNTVIHVLLFVPVCRFFKL